MHVWHLTPDASRIPYRVSAGEWVAINVGTWPIELGQDVWLTVRVEHASGSVDESRVQAIWQRNSEVNSYWRAEIGPFANGDSVRYTVYGRSAEGFVSAPSVHIRIGPKLHLALLWHHHQPLYRDLDHESPKGAYTQPWVRLHAIRDYYAMAHLLLEHPGLHLTINLTPVLLEQILDYVENQATDVALDLSLTPAERLTAEERETVISTFFDAHWHNQIFPHARYKELFSQRRDGRAFAMQDVRDLQMWFNLAWFAKEFREGEITLATGETVDVRRFALQERGFGVDDIAEMVQEQLKILRAIIPVHRELQERGQIEVSTTPFFHPILPLLVDTDSATIDRLGAARPGQFAHPEDATAQLDLAMAQYERLFGRVPRGMWPAEGAVSQLVVPLFARTGIRWIATDRGVLARSDRERYDVDSPDVLCQPYYVQQGNARLSVFFRETWLADHIAFHYQLADDYAVAARAFLNEITERFARRVTRDDSILTVVLDGENAWSAYREDARPFLHALYTLLEGDQEIRTVTFAEYLDGNAARDVHPHPLEAQQRVDDLYTGSWIDEPGSAPGVDMGTWIGEVEENRAWMVLAQTRDELTRSGATPATAPNAYRAVYAAEGSDWFWWFGADQDSGDDAIFDDLFRAHLRSAYRALALTPPRELDMHIAPRVVTWTFTKPVTGVQAGDRIAVQTNCPGRLTWQLDHGPLWSATLIPSGGVLAGSSRHSIVIGPLPSDAASLRFRFRCKERLCEGTDICCREDEHEVPIISIIRDVSAAQSTTTSVPVT